jgi:hypothetical protein
MTHDDNKSSPQRSDAWAKPVDRLNVDTLPEGALNLNVHGRQLSGPVRGFGQLWQKTYRLVFETVQPSPQEVIREWKADFGAFWPKGNKFFSSQPRVEPGTVAVLNAAPVGNAVLISTGVMVIYADEESFSFMTPEGHLFAGLITFSAEREGEKTVAQINALIRANDPLYELLMRLGMSKREDEFWLETLRNVASHFGAKGQLTYRATLVDPKVRWKEAKNIWQNAAIRTVLYRLTKPLLGSRK